MRQPDEFGCTRRTRRSEQAGEIVWRRVRGRRLSRSGTAPEVANREGRPRREARGRPPDGGPSSARLVRRAPPPRAGRPRRRDRIRRQKEVTAAGEKDAEQRLDRRDPGRQPKDHRPWAHAESVSQRRPDAAGALEQLPVCDGVWTDDDGHGRAAPMSTSEKRSTIDCSAPEIQRARSRRKVQSRCLRPVGNGLSPTGLPWSGQPIRWKPKGEGRADGPKSSLLYIRVTMAPAG